MSYQNYHLYPFAIVNYPQEFVISFEEIEEIRGELSVLWINSNKNDV